MHAANGSADARLLAELRQRYLSGMRARIPAERQLGASWLVDKALANAWLVGHIAAVLPEVGGWLDGWVGLVGAGAGEGTGRGGAVLACVPA